MKNRLLYTLIISIVFSVSACMESEEIIISVKEEYKEWLTDYQVGDTIVMIDSNQVEYHLKMTFNEHKIENGYTSVDLFESEKYRGESYEQHFLIDYTFLFELRISSGYGYQHMVLNSNKIEFNYDLKDNEVYYIRDTENNESRHGVNPPTHYSIKSKINFYDSVEIAENQYLEVIYIKLQDFQEYWTDKTVTELYYAKGLGIIQVKFNNGLELTRK